MAKHRGRLPSRAPIGALAALALACAGGGAPAPSPTAAAQAAAPQTAEPAPPGLPRAAAYSAEHGGRALLVVRADEIVFEAGQNGFGPGEAHPIHSGTKSFWGVLAAAADEDGLLDLDEPVSHTLPEFESDPWKREMRIRQLLHLTSGLESGFRALRVETPRDTYARALQLGMVSRPGERFQYGPSHLFVFGEVLRRKLADRGLDPLDYLKLRLLDPIGLEIHDWQRDAAGQPDLPSGAVLAAREWAKFGMLVRDGGRWRGRRVLAEQSLASCFEGDEAAPDYGLGFWLNTPHADAEAARADLGPASGGGPPRVFYPTGLPDLVAATGAGNQRLFVIPSLQLVVVRFGEDDRRFRDDAFLERLLADLAERDAQPGAGR